MFVHPDAPFRDAVDRHRRTMAGGALVSGPSERPASLDRGAAAAVRPILVRI